MFDISGTIVVNNPIRVASNTYIAGQTAPGEGVQIKLGQGQNSPFAILEANNVLVRNLKLRPGPSPLPSPNVDGLSIESSSNIYIDRVSAQFATDENLNVGTEDEPSEDITIARTVSLPCHWTKPTTRRAGIRRERCCVRVTAQATIAGG